MADETINQQPVQPVSAPQEPSRAEERIIQLSDKVRQEAEARTQAENKAVEAERKAAFAESFIDIVAANPAAKDFKADIQAKVVAGYTPEDAALTVLAKAGKLASTPAPAEPVNPAGGSAATNLPQSGNKPVSEMTQAERRAQLEKDIVWQ